MGAQRGQQQQYFDSSQLFMSVKLVQGQSKPKAISVFIPSSAPR